MNIYIYLYLLLMFSKTLPAIYLEDGQELLSNIFSFIFIFRRNFLPENRK